MKNPFKTVNPARPGRSAHDLSYWKKLTCKLGQLIPVCADECVPGDLMKIGAEAVVRFQPLVAPILHSIKMYVHYFFVPYRLLWPEPNGWETFITGGVDGNQHPSIPRWDPTNHTANVQGKLWDYLGFPIGTTCAGVTPLDFPRRAYYMIYNEYYRDETLQTKLDITDDANQDILTRNWSKDYFTSALLWQQRGTAPALPISGIISTNAEWAGSDFLAGSLVLDIEPTYGIVASRVSPSYDLILSNTQNGNITGNPIDVRLLTSVMNNNTVDVDVSGATTFNVSDLRLAFQIQRFMEKMARGGFRYREYLYMVHGVDNKDERLQRPEYIGGTVAPVIISEVLQTSNNSADNTPQGNMAGHGISVHQDYIGKYFATEFGMIMGIMSIVPVPVYGSQGINRQWLRRTQHDFYVPDYANLSEQAIETGELYASNSSVDNLSVFGFQGRYDEMRVKQNMICAGMRGDFDYWHLARFFSGKPELNASFVSIDPSTLTRIFADEEDDGLMVDFGNLIKAIRPIPISCEPGRIDH